MSIHSTKRKAGTDDSALSQAPSVSIGSKRSKLTVRSDKSRAAGPSRTGEFSFPSTTILKLTKLFTMFEYERIYQEEEAPFYFRVIGLLGESLSKVLEVEQVVLKKEGKGRGNSILERVKGPPMALKVQTTERPSSLPDHLVDEWGLSIDVSLATANRKWRATGQPRPILPIILRANLSYATQADAVRDDGGELGWTSGMFTCALLEKGLPLESILSSSITNERRLRLFQNAHNIIQIFHRAGFVNRDIKFANMVVLLEYDADGNATPTDQVRLIDIGTALRVGTKWMDDDGEMAEEPLGTPPFMSMDVLTVHAESAFLEGLKAGRFEGIWDPKDIVEMQSRLKIFRSETVLTASDLWALGCSIIKSLDQKFFDTHALTREDFDSVRNAFTKTIPVPTYHDIKKVLGDLAPRFSVFHQTRDYLLRTDSDGKQISLGKVDPSYRQLLADLLVPPVTDSLHFKIVSEDDEARAKTISTDLEQMILRNSGSAMASETLDSEMTDGKAPKEHATVTKSKVKSKTASTKKEIEILREEITGEIDGDMMLFRAHVENTSGFILQRSFKCGLSDCLRRAKDGPYIARTHDELVKHLRKINSDGSLNKSRCAYFSREDAQPTIGFKIIDRLGETILSPWKDSAPA